MKAINTLLIGIILSLAPLSLQAQSSKDNQAKAYYFVALEAFEAKQYDEVLASIKNVEDLLGSSNARLSALKVKTYFEQNKLDKAKAELDTFFSYQSSDEQGREMASYLRNINSGRGPNEIEAENLERQRKELLKAQRPQMIEEFESLKGRYIDYLDLKRKFEGKEEAIKPDLSSFIRSEQQTCDNNWATYETREKGCRMARTYQNRQEAAERKYWAYKALEDEVESIESSSLRQEFQSICNKLSEEVLSTTECSQKVFH